VDAIFSVFAISCENHLGIRARLEAVSLASELLPQLDKVEDLAIERYSHGAVWRRHWLSTSGEINDGEASVPETDFSVGPDVLLVWTTVSQQGHHSPDGRPVSSKSVQRGNSRYSAHGKKGGRLV
jgi:hypothetical protein